MRSRNLLKPWLPALLLSVAVGWLVSSQRIDHKKGESGQLVERARTGGSSSPLSPAPIGRPREAISPTPDHDHSSLSQASSLDREIGHETSNAIPRGPAEVRKAFELAVGPVLLRSLPDAQRRQIFDHFQNRLSTPLEPHSYLCWSEGTPIQILEASHRAESTASRLVSSAFSVQAFQSIGSGRWTSTATDGSTGSLGTPVTLTWSIAPDGTKTDDGSSTDDEAPSDLIARLAVIYAVEGANTLDPPHQQPWFQVFTTAYEELARETGINFVYEENDDGADMSSGNDGALGVRGDLRIHGKNIDGNFNVLAYNFSPGYGDMVIDTSDSFFNSKSSNSLRLRNTLGHEVGHGLGLGHVCPVNNTKLMEPFINLGFVSAQFDDVLSMQRRYGDHLEKHNSSLNNDSIADATLLEPVVDTPLAIAERLSLDDNSDVDYYKIDALTGQALIATTTPTAEEYLEGSQNSDGSCGGDTLYDFSSYHDLKLTVIGPDGTSQIAASDSSGLGESESIHASFETDGTYFIGVKGGSANNTQIYSLDLLLYNPTTTLALASSDITADEGNPSDTATITVTSSTPVPSEFTVTLIPSGSASASDYSGNLTATIPIGETESNPVTISAAPDIELEGTESLRLSLPLYSSETVSYDLGEPSYLDVQLIDSPAAGFTLGITELTSESFSLQNGVPDPGETIVYGVNIENTGTADATLVTATLSGPAGFIPFTTDASYGTIPHGGDQTGNFTFALNGACGSTHQLDLQIDSDEGVSATFPLPITLGSLMPDSIENFEHAGALPTDWVSSMSGAGSGWSATTARSNSGSYSSFAANPFGVGSSILETTAFEIPENPGSVSFSHFYNTETGWDGGVFEISIDGGPWQDIEDAGGVFTSNGYNSTLNNSTNPLAQRGAWSGNSGGFVTTTVDLPSSTSGESVRFRWFMGSDAFVSDEGWYLDDFSTPTSPSCDETGPLLVLEQTGTEISELSTDQTVELAISTSPLLPTAGAIPLTFSNSGTGEISVDTSDFSAASLTPGESSTTLSVAAQQDDLIEGNETLVLTLDGASETVIISIDDSRYGSWAATNLGTSGKIEPDDDFDGDGFLNIEEYAYGTTPNDADSLPPSDTVTSETELEILAPPAPLPEGLTVIGETSTDARIWTTDGVTTTPDGFKVPLTGTQRFLRLAYTLAP